MALPKQNRLKGKREFTKIFSEAQQITSEHFSVRVVRDNSGGGQQYAVIVPVKAVALASKRNLIRRKVLEALSDIIHGYLMVTGIHAVISVRTMRLPDADTLERELLSLLKKSGILHT